MAKQTIDAYNYDCEICGRCRVTYREYDTGYTKYSCELMEGLLNCDEYPIQGDCYECCPLNFNYEVKEGEIK